MRKSKLAVLFLGFVFATTFLPAQLDETPQGIVKALTDDVDHVAEQVIDVVSDIAELTEKVSGLLGAIGPVASLVAGLVNVFLPASDPVLDAIKNLQKMMTARFDEIERQIDEAVNEIKLEVQMTSFNEHVTRPIGALQHASAAFFDASNGNWTKAMAEPLINLCKDNTEGPQGILEALWSKAGEGCTNFYSRLKEGKASEAHALFSDTCVTYSYIEKSDYSEKSVQAALTLVQSTLAKISALQAVCLNITYADPPTYEMRDKQFKNVAKQISDFVGNNMPTFLEHYWTDRVEKLVTDAIGKDTRAHSGEMAGLASKGAKAVAGFDWLWQHNVAVSPKAHSWWHSSLSYTLDGHNLATSMEILLDNLVVFVMRNRKDNAYKEYKAKFLADRTPLWGSIWQDASTHNLGSYENFVKFEHALEENKVPPVQSQSSAHTVVVVIEGVYQVGASYHGDSMEYLKASCGSYDCFLLVAL